jgi:hypothetical protein
MLPDTNTTLSGESADTVESECRVDLFDASAKINAATVNGGQSETATGSLLAPIPVAAPNFVST